MGSVTICDEQAKLAECSTAKEGRNRAYISVDHGPALASCVERIFTKETWMAAFSETKLITKTNSLVD